MPTLINHETSYQDSERCVSEMDSQYATTSRASSRASLRSSSSASERPSSLSARFKLLEAQNEGKCSPGSPTTKLLNNTTLNVRIRISANPPKPINFDGPSFLGSKEQGSSVPSGVGRGRGRGRGLVPMKKVPEMAAPTLFEKRCQGFWERSCQLVKSDRIIKIRSYLMSKRNLIRKATIDDLNDEELLLIFRNLDLKDQFSCERVCRRWSRLAGEILKRQTNFDQVKESLKDRYLNVNSLSHVLDRCTALTHVSLEGMPSLQFDERLTRTITQLNSLVSINLAGSIIYDEQLTMIAISCGQLKNINLTGCIPLSDASIYLLMMNCKKLEEVQLNDLPRLRGNHMFMDPPPNLVSISMLNCPQLDLAAIISLSHSMIAPKLTTLKVSLNNEMATSIIGSGAFKQLKVFECDTHKDLYRPELGLLGRLEDLYELNIGCYDHVLSDTDLIQILSSCRHLRSFGIFQQVKHYRCGKLSDSSIELIPSFCPDLSSLSIEYARDITIRGVSAFSQFQRLQRLSLRGCNEVILGCIAELLLDCPHLSWIDARGCEVTKWSIDCMISAVNQIDHDVQLLVYPSDDGTQWPQIPSNLKLLIK